MTKEQEITWQDRDVAGYMPLAGGPVSKAAEDFVESLFQSVVLPTLTSVPRPTSVAKYRVAIGALLSDLLRFHVQKRGGKHGMSPGDFSSENLGFGYDIFKRVKDALEAAHLLQYKRGWKRAEAGFEPGSIVRTGGDLAFFRPLPRLLNLAGASASERWGNHWRAGQPRPAPNAARLQLRAMKRQGQRQGRTIPVNIEDKFADFLLKDIDETNAFLANAGIGGFGFVGLRRIFNDGDEPGKLWRRGGRYYSLRGGDAYERMNGDTRRSQITINGEAVVEVDISASHLTILYGIQGMPLDASVRDPYEVKGFPRTPVKLWITSAIGKGLAESARWSPGSGKLYRKEFPNRRLGADFKAAEVRRAVIQRHPIFHELAELGLSPLDFQWHESDILRIAMKLLRGEGVPSLPVHDSLIVPVSKSGLAQEALQKAFMFHFESDSIIPRLKVKGPGLS